VVNEGILTWRRGYRDHEGGSSRARLFHCTSVELTLANIPNVDISGVQFLVVGTAFALSRIINLKTKFSRYGRGEE